MSRSTKISVHYYQRTLVCSTCQLTESFPFPKQMVIAFFSKPISIFLIIWQIVANNRFDSTHSLEDFLKKLFFLLSTYFKFTSFQLKCTQAKKPTERKSLSSLILKYTCAQNFLHSLKRILLLYGYKKLCAQVYVPSK